MTIKSPKSRLAAQAYVDGILSNNRVILSKAITVIESHLESDKELSKAIIRGILAFTGNSIRITITGAPGVGKSTFIEAFGKHIIGQGYNVVVLSIDPSSQRSKGSILGDKTRMEALSHMENAYIRPSSSGNKLGGVAHKTAETILLCEAAGYNVIIIETVGVGQSETAAHSMTDFFILLMLAGAGDELQGIKKGIMELADMIIINKADGDNILKSENARLEYKNALHLFPPAASGWETVVTKASSIQNIGIDSVWDTVIAYKDLATKNGYFNKNRNEQNIQRMQHNINDAIKDLFFNSEIYANKISSLENDVLEYKITPNEAAKNIIEIFKKSI